MSEYGDFKGMNVNLQLVRKEEAENWPGKKA